MRTPGSGHQRERASAGSPNRDSSMANKMLIDATHPEETRVVVVRGNRVEEFDFESASRRQLRGNIYLAKVTRVEPSLQAAFVEYGGNRHGFLAFSEIHPDYYQIPVADRQALMAEGDGAHREAEDEVDRRAGRRRGRGAERRRDTVRSTPVRPEAGPEASDQPEATAALAVSHEAQFTDGDAVSPAAGEETRAPDQADGSADPSTSHEAQFADAAAEDHAEQVRASAEAESPEPVLVVREDRKSTRLNSSHTVISYAVFCLKKKKENKQQDSNNEEADGNIV